MKKLSKIQFLLLNVILLAILILSGAFIGVIYKLYITQFILFFAGLYLIPKSPYTKKTTFVIIFLPILLIYGSGYVYDLIYDEGYLGKPFFWGYIVILLLLYVNQKFDISKKKTIYLFLICSTLLTAYAFYTHIQNDKDKIDVAKTSHIRFKDNIGKEYSLDDFKGKLTLLEFWTTSCSQCPESISKFQEMADKYKFNESIDFRVVNINLNKQQNVSIFNKIESKIKLKKLYANKTIFEQLNFIAAPSILVVNKYGEIVYFGYPNFEKFTQNYLPYIIDKELSKM